MSFVVILRAKICITYYLSKTTIYVLSMFCKMDTLSFFFFHVIFKKQIKRTVKQSVLVRDTLISDSESPSPSQSKLYNNKSSHETTQITSKDQTTRFTTRGTQTKHSITLTHYGYVNSNPSMFIETLTS